MSYAVSQVAKLAGVTVRTLHHYDEIGLLSPGERTAAGYRRYTEPTWNGCSRSCTTGSSGSPSTRSRRSSTTRRPTRRRTSAGSTGCCTGRVKQAAGDGHGDRVRDGGRARWAFQLTPEERFEVFGDVDPDRYAEEAEQRWGGTDAYAESVRRTNRYSKADWLRFKAESEDWGRRFVAAMDAGAPADGPAAMDLAEEHRQQISRWFYDCSYEIHTGLADMYVGRPAVQAHYENIKPGMARHLHDAIHANAITRA